MGFSDYKDLEAAHTVLTEQDDDGWEKKLTKDGYVFADHLDPETGKLITAQDFPPPAPHVPTEAPPHIDDDGWAQKVQQNGYEFARHRDRETHALVTEDNASPSRAERMISRLRNLTTRQER